MLLHNKSFIQISTSSQHGSWGALFPPIPIRYEAAFTYKKVPIFNIIKSIQLSRPEGASKVKTLPPSKIMGPKTHVYSHARAKCMSVVDALPCNILSIEFASDYRRLWIIRIEYFQR